MQDDRSLSEYKGEMAMFILSLSLLTPASTEAMLIFKQWFASAALLLMSLRLKLARPQPSPLIKRFKRRWDGDGPGTQDAHSLTCSGQLAFAKPTQPLPFALCCVLACVCVAGASPAPGLSISCFNRARNQQVKVLLAALVARLDEATPATGLCRAHLFPRRTT